MAARRRRVAEPEEHENHERWLVTYADLITVLMALFIVLYAMSYTDVEKFKALKESLAVGFGQPSPIQNGGQSVLTQQGNSVADAAQVNHNAAGAVTLKFSDTVDETVQTRKEAREELSRLREIEGRLRRALRDEGLYGDVSTAIDERGLVVSLVSRHVVFRNDLATLSPRGRRVVDTVGPVLAEVPDKLEIAGNTNQVDVRPAYFDTDWDLSSARAVTVLRRLEERLKVPTRRLSVAAYGQTRPLVDPDTPGSQEMNKRVDIVVLSGKDPAVRGLLPELDQSIPQGDTPS